MEVLIRPLIFLNVQGLDRNSHNYLAENVITCYKAIS